MNILIKGILMVVIVAVLLTGAVNGVKAEDSEMIMPVGTSAFMIKDSSSNQLFRVQSDGNVGIANTSPTQKLDVTGTVKATAFVGDGSGLTNLASGGGSGDGHSLNSADNSKTDVVFVDNSGNVGIGTTEPERNFVVSGTNMSTIANIENISSTASVFPGLNVFNYMGTTGGHPFLNMSNIGGSKSRPSATVSNRVLGTLAVGGHDGSNKVSATRITSRSETSFSSNNHPATIEFRTHPSANPWDSAALRMVIKSNGNVGIGNTSPREKLDVAGTVKATAFVGDGSGLTGIVGSGGSGNSLNAADGDPANALFVDASGNVGIGTTNLGGAKLKVEVNPNKSFFITEVAPFGPKSPPLTDEGVSLNLSRLFDGLGAVSLSIANSSGFSGDAILRARSNIRFYGNNTERVRITESGNVGIGTTNPSQKLDVAGNINASGSVTQGSSREFKNNIAYISTQEAIDAVNNLNPVRFNYKRDNTGEEHLGFIAEDVPNIVASHDRKHLNAMDLTAVFAKVIQEQQRTIEVMEKEMKVLKSTMNQIIKGRL